MPIERMSKKASDNIYLHKDFHMALNNGLIYLHNNYGFDAVKAYLTEFTREFHAPLKERLIKEGLLVLREYFDEIYKKEQSKVEMILTEDELFVSIDKCPAVTHIKNNGQEPYEHYIETTATVYKALCDGTSYEFTLDSYDNETGRAQMRFSRRRT